LTYHFQTPRDLFEKLKRDGAKLDLEVTGDNVFNFVITAYHLRDWIEAGPAQGSQAIEADLRALWREAAIKICRDLANASKHFTITRYSPTVNQATVIPVSRPFRVGASPLGGRDGLAGAWRDRVTVEVAGVTHDLCQIKNVVMDLYEEFFQRHGL